MTDYTKATGSGGVMLIRDNGTTVYFYLTAGSTSSWVNGASFSWTMNGSGSGTYNYPTGANALLIRSAVISTSQTVTFAIGASGTSGIGGPTSFSVAINRGSVPPAPTAVGISALTSTSMTSAFSSNGDGGSPFIRWELGWGKLANGPQYIITTSGTNSINALTPGTTYYFWARGVNAEGTGGWSVRTSATTLRVPDAPNPIVLSAITSSTLMATFTGNGSGGAVIDSWEIGYGTSSTAPTTSVVSDGSTAIAGLVPGTTYYFWARGHNSIGWSPYSARTTATTPRVPDAPNSVVLSAIEQTTIVASFSGNGDGGAPITQWQIGYGTSSIAPTTSVTSTGTTTITGLTPGTTYYFWARGLNSVGWGPYSVRTTAKTIAGARVNVAGVWKDAIPYVRVAGVWKVAEGWAKIAGLWKETG